MKDRLWRNRHWLLPSMCMRAALFLIILISGLLTVPVGRALLWCLVLAVVSLPGTFAPAHPVFGRLGRLAEIAVVVAQVMGPDGGDNWMLPFLLAPLGGAAMFGGLRDETAPVRQPRSVLSRYPGLTEAGLLAIGCVAALSVTSWISPFVNGAGYARAVISAIGLGLIAAAVGHWLRQLLHAEMPPGARPYAEATALLTQLRAVARQLPGGTLDPGGISADLLERLRQAAPADRAAVMVAHGGGNRLVVLAQTGEGERVDWETSLPANTLLADTWAGQQAHTGTSSLARSGTGQVSSLVVPLVADRRTVGLVLLESDLPDAYPSDVVDAAVESTTGAALRLETALLFEEVQSLATMEERQRLAREIHDGIAQELAMLGYGIDHALAQLPADATDSAEQLQELRDEVTRLITELRLSLFELRSEVDRHGGLTTAIADYARTVGSSAGLRVHLSLDEGGARLPAATEAELLRIAQEAITNARKHARAENLWVTCEVDPPYARIEVADDGTGVSGEGADGRYGLTIMSERAERIRGSLEIRPRDPHGTTVAVLLAPSDRPGTVSSEAVRE
ncbi:GAF domain-containing sensor histidine kinase [Stackebrandtia nassauensis]|uniref:GAF sensor signal transduction histidine kinase n=1 Tax=Stackebrandtia nassauensis (strain DSM 44728 / CIP 108903 / NRRL B-16338 / NBRC 102104 / LLR-40K-21) TaxID=446470 RepID=D3Q8R9_STANL|nr:GAF domain-containing sensor histidine kinase [Stackebrandtia nassauensis]ADD44511.1 GAF sensor signal transduction histidine kinase [Stackebrandtia nassauensis DSM 44728]